MDRSEREFRELTARFRRLAASCETGGPADAELSECRDRLMGHVRDGGPRGRESLWFLLEAALPELLVFLSSRVRTRESADDLAQQVITAVLTAYDNGNKLRLEHGAASFYEYLYTAARREAARHRVRPGESAEVLTAPDELPPVGVGVDAQPGLPEFPAGTAEFWQWLGQATRHLPTDVYELVFLSERVLARVDRSNPSQDKQRARKKFINWFGVLWVARTMRAVAAEATPACTALNHQLGSWNSRDGGSFTVGIYALVRRHIRGCTTCRPVFEEFTDTGTGGASQSSRLLDKFRTLPVAAVPEGLRRWLEQQRADDDRERRRTLAEILLAWRRPDTANNAGSAEPVRLWRDATGGVMSAAANVARLPVIAPIVQVAQQNPGLAGGAAAIVVMVTVSAVTLLPSRPEPPAAPLPVAADVTPTLSPSGSAPPTPASSPSNVGSTPSASAPAPSSGSPSPSPSRPATTSAPAVAGPPPPTGGPPAPPPDSNTTIAFSSDRDGGPGSFEIYTMAYPGGTPVVKLTDQTAVRHAGSWSPDGRRIAFTSNRHAQGDTDIFTMNADGSGIRNLTSTSTATEQWPTWSPDGRRIAFMSDREPSRATAIFTMNADTGGDVARITPADGSWHPAWSPALPGGGSKIAFSINGDAIWTMNPDGTGRQKLSSQTVDFYGTPAWSSDGRIAFARCRDAVNCAIGYMRPLPGAEQVMLMQPQGANLNPSWSPSGRHIAFSSNRAGNDEIYTVDVADGSLVRLTTNSVSDWAPLWKPTG